MSASRLVLVGLGPAGLERVPRAARRALTDPDRTVVVRTLRHPAAVELAALRDVDHCDDLYQTAETIDDVYEGIVERVWRHLDDGPVVYAVPGSVAVGERAAAELLRRARSRGIDIETHPGASFVDLACLAVGVDPVTDGSQIVDGRDLPDPFPLHVPTFITQVDTPLVLADVAVSLGRLLSDDAPITVLARLGSPDEESRTVPLAGLPRVPVDERTTVFVPAAHAGWFGLVATNRVLRRECPWDAEQTHHTLATHLIEEAYETLHAIADLPPDAPAGEPDMGAYAELEEELGDLLLQVVFHSTLAAEAGAFDIDDVAETVRRKLVRRHPHVFGDVEVADATEVKANWESIKRAEKARASLVADIPETLPGITRADKIQRRVASVGFDWADAAPIFDVVAAELDELRAVAGDRAAATMELGDVLFSVVNLARHLGVDPEIALAEANAKFVRRFEKMERIAADRGDELRDLPADALEALWSDAKGEPPGSRS